MTTDKRRDALLAKRAVDDFLAAIVGRKRGGHRFPWWPYAAAAYQRLRVQPYLPWYMSYEVRSARTEEKRGGRPSVVAVEVALQTGKRDRIVGELTVIREKGRWGVVPTKWKVKGIERSE